MFRPIPALLLCAAACSARVRPRSAATAELPMVAMDTTPIRAAEPGLDLSGAWATGSGEEPAVPRVVMRLECNYTPPFWIIQQNGDTVRAWTNPESRAQGIRAPDRPRPVMAAGRLRGLDVAMGTDGTRYVLRYDPQSGHLRGTLNGQRFWAVREEMVRATGCIPVP